MRSRGLFASTTSTVRSRPHEWGFGTLLHNPLPEPLFEDLYDNKGITHTGYDVDRDGRFLVIGNDSPQNETMTVILNWTEELRRQVPVD